MLLEKITEEELLFMQDFYNPIAMIECLFSDFDNLGEFDEEKFGALRNYQLSMLSYEYLIDEDQNISSKENFKLREGAGNIFCFGGRKYGKTLCVEMLDMLVSMVLLGSEHVGFSSYDALHIRGILEKIIQSLDLHPFFYNILEPKVNRSPNYHFYLRSGYTLDSVNMNLGSKSPGAQFFQKHFTRLYLEEASFESEEVNKKRIDSISENGCVQRIAGMTNFTKYSPAGKVFYDYDKRSWLSNYPQFVNSKWDDIEKKKAIKDHGGESSLSYRVFVKGEVVEEGISVFDMERVKKCYDETREIKHIEIQKQHYPNFRNLVIVDRPPHAESCYVCADIGESAPTEITIFFKLNEKYRYSYNITLYSLTDKEQLEIFKFLYTSLKSCFIGLDTTEGTGRAIFRSLAEIYPAQQLVWVGFNEKTKVDFARDEENNVIFEDGQPTYKEEYIADWSVKRLKDLCYDEKLSLPLDHKLDIQLNSVISTTNATRTIYECVAEEDHLFASFRVFAIAEWLNEFNILRPLTLKKFAKGGV
jgi:hypothetical protein